MPKRIDIVGMRFGRLVALGREAGSRALCRCDCGEEKSFSIGMLRSGRSGSCGCLRIDVIRQRCATHGMSKSPEFTAYQNAKNRCRREKDPRYSQYGGRGIEFRFETFAEFIEHIGHRPDGTSLDRIDSNGHYERGNVRWATLKEQARNKTSSRIVEFRGKRMPLKAACEITGTPYKRAFERIVYGGWEVDRALS
jgi:hypothetical protein